VKNTILEGNEEIIQITGKNKDYMDKEGIR